VGERHYPSRMGWQRSPSTISPLLCCACFAFGPLAIISHHHRLPSPSKWRQSCASTSSPFTVEHEPKSTATPSGKAMFSATVFIRLLHCRPCTSSPATTSRRTARARSSSTSTPSSLVTSCLSRRHRSLRRPTPSMSLSPPPLPHGCLHCFRHWTEWPHGPGNPRSGRARVTSGLSPFQQCLFTFSIQINSNQVQTLKFIGT
jgi:hypothetical protein